MRKKKPKLTTLTPIERALMPPKIQAAPAKKAPDPSFFLRDPKHPYGTCWNCGTAREIPGGLPNGFDSYFCKKCDRWLKVRAN